MMNIGSMFNLRSLAPWIVIFAGLAIVPFFTHNIFYLTVMYTYLIYLTLSQSFNLVAGFGGLFSFGHGQFFAIGAFTFAVLLVAHVSAPIGFLVVALVGLLGGTLLTFVVKGVTGGAFALSTFAVSSLLQVMFENFPQLGGFVGISTPPLFIPITTLYWIMFAITVIAFITMKLYLNSDKHGLSLMALRDDETAARHIGISTLRLKIESMSISALFFAVTGAFWILVSHYFVAVAGGEFDFTWSFYPILGMLIGGVGEFVGPLVGAAFLTIIIEVLTFDFPAYVDIAFGLAFLIISLRFSDGIVGFVRQTVIKRRARAAVATKVAPKLQEAEAVTK